VKNAAGDDPGRTCRHGLRRRASSTKYLDAAPAPSVGGSRTPCPGREGSRRPSGVGTSSPAAAESTGLSDDVLRGVRGAPGAVRRTARRHRVSQLLFRKRDAADAALKKLHAERRLARRSRASVSRRTAPAEVSLGVLARRRPSGRLRRRSSGPFQRADDGILSGLHGLPRLSRRGAARRGNGSDLRGGKGGACISAPTEDAQRRQGRLRTRWPRRGGRAPGGGHERAPAVPLGDGGRDPRRLGSGPVTRPFRALRCPASPLAIPFSSPWLSTRRASAFPSSRTTASWSSEPQVTSAARFARSSRRDWFDAGRRPEDRLLAARREGEPPATYRSRDRARSRSISENVSAHALAALLLAALAARPRRPGGGPRGGGPVRGPPDDGGRPQIVTARSDVLAAVFVLATLVAVLASETGFGRGAGGDPGPSPSSRWGPKESALLLPLSPSPPASRRGPSRRARPRRRGLAPRGPRRLGPSDGRPRREACGEQPRRPSPSRSALSYVLKALGGLRHPARRSPCDVRLPQRPTAPRPAAPLTGPRAAGAGRRSWPAAGWRTGCPPSRSSSPSSRWRPALAVVARPHPALPEEVPVAERWLYLPSRAPLCSSGPSPPRRGTGARAPAPFRSRSSSRWSGAFLQPSETFRSQTALVARPRPSS